MFKSLKKGKKRRGMTLPEMMISVTLFTFVGVFVAFTTLLIARQVSRSLRSIPADQKAYRLLDRVRTELMAAQIGAMTIENGGQGVTFLNPSRATNSRIWRSNDGRCMWDPTVGSDGDEVAWEDVRECRFTLGPNGKTLEILIATTGKDRQGDPVPVTYSDVIVMRN
jgi:prepilin-type N-terminal cleavage/methylation domain-containing protein